MKASHKILYSAVAIACTGLLVYALRTSNTKRRKRRVSNEGYEIAADMLFPNTGRRFKKLHYGPVLPHHDF